MDATQPAMAREGFSIVTVEPDASMNLMNLQPTIIQLRFAFTDSGPSVLWLDAAGDTLKEEEIPVPFGHGARIKIKLASHSESTAKLVKVLWKRWPKHPHPNIHNEHWSNTPATTGLELVIADKLDSAHAVPGRWRFAVLLTARGDHWVADPTIIDDPARTYDSPH